MRDLVLDLNAPERILQSCSFRGKFVKFCIDEDVAARRTFPLFPCDINKLLSYGLWLSDNGINGYDSVRQYLGACCSWGAELGFSDARDETPVHAALFAKWRSRFKSDVPSKKRTRPKLDMRPELMEAMAVLSAPHDRSDVGTMEAYTFLYFSSIRVGHVAPAKRTRAAHCLLWGNVIITRDSVFVFLYSTKTLATASDRGWWTVLAARPLGHFMLDPVRVLTL